MYHPTLIYTMHLLKLNPNLLPQHFPQTAVGSSLLLPLDHASGHSAPTMKTLSQPAEKRKLPSIDACFAFCSEMAGSQLDAPAPKSKIAGIQPAVAFSKIAQCWNPNYLRLEKISWEIGNMGQSWAVMTEALNEFGKPSQIDEGDYGPKIDISVSDALKRKFQCATFQVEMHYEGNWPFWLSPRQPIVCPVSAKSMDYAKKGVREKSDKEIMRDTINYVTDCIHHHLPTMDESTIGSSPFWIKSDPKLIFNPQMMKLHSFDTKIHKVDPLVSYKNDEDLEEESVVLVRNLNVFFLPPLFFCYESFIHISDD
ncbi:Threonine--tRNA ligase, mitochondrial 1 [Linum perenne]